MEQPSEPESQIIGILNNMHILFDRERTFSNLISKTENVLLPVDFALNINGFLAIIEYNGSQHYKAKNNTDSAQDALRRLSANGTARLNYCSKNDIPILIIHYKDKEKIIKIISSFIDDVKNNIHGTTKAYTQHTKAYFRNIPYHTFEVDPTGPIKPIQVHENDNLGYLSLSNDAIVWTKKELDTLLSRTKYYEQKVQQYKTVTADLVLTIDSLQHELVEKDALLQHVDSTQQPVETIEAETKPKIQLDFTDKYSTSLEFKGDFRKTNSPRSQLTDDAKIFIKALSKHHEKVSEIQDYLQNNYHENISLTTLKKCIL
ncbi:hypothetical protein M5C72_11910 [Companilactobacillus allii]|uniref:Uncharacterized protein n=1 Tax=Companilactobacillus allii TaxID=1847728 RepID=A0A1P8Q0U9_9LACO|nr:hypothetical protein [Companilactobacillus allii]APX71451.1 hypothetical protein BTM29_02275 [Companilactobacillus allii]USQ68531.1 hypothetical protein M5C72_11910 [Companilactobacillus allii]